MGLETPTYIGDFVQANPAAGDARSEGDDHLRNIKIAVQNTLPGLTGRFGRVQTKSGTYTPVLTDNSTLIKCSAAFSLTLTAAATLGNGWFMYVKAGNGAVTIDPAGAELVNGVATVAIPSGAMALVVCDGAAFDLTLLSDPAGEIKDFGGTAVPAGFLGCDGAAVSRATYAALFAAISTTWGVGDGSTTFNVPNFQRKVAVGSGGSGTGTLGASVGNTGGAETHTLSVAEMPVHSHNVTGGTGGVSANHTHSYYNPGDTAIASGGGGIGVTSLTVTLETGTISADHSHSFNVTSGNAGSGSAHNNMQPSNVVLKIIRTGL